ncbi:protein phosphatase regulator [Malassezia cuniculi]|uniref:Protein phosphatase regulator n=1 Tax=Malassezia cuniculi TaxID=948313 RepID=A0AAF0ESR5_9BASI|nr:protein phosphatase regulator [Malassezia cuniculi]
MRQGVDASYGQRRVMLYDDDNGYNDFDADAYDDDVNNELGVQEYAYDGAEDLHEDGMYDDEAHDDDDYDDELDDEELSSSPSIPDENINFDLVYALHTFVATVEGQATVHKGDHLTLLDDSNSYWWLVRVMSSQEVGYIPAENIETPYERLARLNKHRNVEITTATENDHDQVPRNIYSGHLIKARQRGVNKHSGKPSALSRREVNVRNAPKVTEKKRGVIFGQSEYVEHSGDEASYEGEYEEDAYEEDEEDEEGDEEGGVYGEDEAKQKDAAEAEPAADEHDDESDAVHAADTGAGSAKSGTRNVLGLFDPDDSLLQGLPSDSEGRRQRPGSLLGMSGSGSVFNVVRVFAGDHVESSATFKTVLLSKTTKASDLVRQAMQRFRVEDDPNDYSIVLKHVDGEEHVLWADEYPLEILESLSDEDEAASRRQSHDSVGSLSSLIDANSSRVAFDYSDDRFGKLYLVHTASYAAATEDITPNSSGDADHLGVPDRDAGSMSPGTATTRFTLQLALFPRDLPDGKVFHPKTGVAIHGDPATARMDRPQTRLLSFAKNTTVAEVIESALTHFQVLEGVVDGGDDVDERMPNTRGRTRVKYSLSVVTDDGERRLNASSKVLSSYDTPPLFKTIDAASLKALKRGSLEMQQYLGAPEDISDTDPLFVLRQARTVQARNLSSASSEGKSEGRSDSRTEGRAETRQHASESQMRSAQAAQAAQAARVAENRNRAAQAAAAQPTTAASMAQVISSVPSSPAGSPRRTPPRKSSAPHTPEREHSVSGPDSPTPTRGSALPLADTNDQMGVDLILNNKVRLRSARTNESPRIRYSLLQNGGEQDVSSVLRDVLANKVADDAGAAGQTGAQTDAAGASGDLLERFVDRMPDMTSNSITDTIDLMLDRISHMPEDSQAMESFNNDVVGDTMPLFSSREAPEPLVPDDFPQTDALSVSHRGVDPASLDMYEPVIKTKVDLNALYGIVNAMAMVPSDTPITREHKRVLSQSSTASSHGWLQQSTSQLAKLLEDPEEVKVLETTSGLIGPDWPRSTHAPGSEIAATKEKYAPLMSQVSMIEASLDDVLRTTLHIDN